MTESVWDVAKKEVELSASKERPSAWEQAQTEIELESKPQHRAVAGMWERVRNPMDFKQNDSYLKDLVQLGVKKARGTALGSEEDNKQFGAHTTDLPIALEEANDQLNYMWENGMGDTPEYSQLEEQYYQQLDNYNQQSNAEVSLVDSFLSAWEADKAGVGAELISAAIEDPEFFFIPEAGVAIGTKLAAAFSRLGTTAYRTTRAAGAIAGGAAFESALAVSLQAARDLNREGELVPENMKSAAIMGAVTGGIIGGVSLGIKAIRETRAKKAFEAAREEMGIRTSQEMPEEFLNKVSNTAEDLVSMVEAKASASRISRSIVDKIAEKSTSSITEGDKGVRIAGSTLTKAQKQKRKDVRDAIKEASEPQGRTGESLADFYARMGRDGMQDWNQRLKLASDSYWRPYS